MAATDGQITLAASRFGDTTPAYLRDFAKTELPAVAKIIKGQYHNLGVPTLSNPSLQSTALFLNAGKKYQILAQPIKIKDGRKPTNVGPKVLIPESYPGFFELLSEDGRSTRCIENVADLARKQNLRVLVRETFRCNHLMKTVHAGEILTTLYENGKYLKCRTQKDEVISLPLDTKAKFSPIAKEESISGVHSVRNLLKKRMPVVVRLVYGTAPKGLKQPFVPELRLLGCVEIDRVFALPLQKDTDLVAVPLNAKLKLQRAKNMDQLGNFIEYLRFLDKAQRLLAEARDRLQIVDIKLSDKEKKDSKNGSTVNPLHCINLIPGLENGYVLRKSLSCDSSRSIQQHVQNGHYGGQKTQHGSSHHSTQHHNHNNPDLSPILDEYNDIDQIYDYVRGLAPLPKNMNRFESPVICASADLSAHHHHQPSVPSSSSAHQLQHHHSHAPHPQTGQHHPHHHHHQQTLASNGTTASTSIHKSPSTDMAKSQPDSGNYSLIRTNNNSSSNNNNSLTSSSGGHHSNSHHNTNNNISSNTTASNSNNNGQPYNNHHHSHQHQLHNLQQQQQHHHAHNNYNLQHDDRPVPPPIETIPGKKLTEKRQRPTLPKLYVKNSNSSSGTSHGQGQPTTTANAPGHQKNAAVTPVGASGATNAVHSPAGGYVINAKDGLLEPQSPLFHIRYKSLSSLQLSPDSNPTTPSPSGGLLKGGLLGAASPSSHNNATSNGSALAASVANGSIIGPHHNHHHQYHPHHNHHSHATSTENGVSGGGHPLMKSASTQCSGPAREGTLDSSRSGGRTSGDSSQKQLPEKKTRRLSRPRSLSNLVWELRPQKDKASKTQKKLYVHHYDNRQQPTTLYL